MQLENLLLKNSQINVTVSGSDLMELGKGIAEQTAKLILENHEEKVYTRKEVLAKFKISHASLWRWEKIGLIQGKRIGNRKYYPESEINRLVKTQTNG